MNHLTLRIVPYFIFILLFCSCSQRKSVPIRTFNSTEVQKVDETYHHYRENFFKYFLDEGQNRFNGCVPEKIYIKPEKLNDENYLENYQKIKFADATIYASMALMFLSNDLIFNIKQDNQKEANRSRLLLRQVLDGIVLNDKLSTAGIDGFFLRDTVGQMKDITVESDFINTKGGSNEMSGSQSSALYYGFYFALKTLSQLDENKIEGLEKIIGDIKKSLQLLTEYLTKNNFRILSEIHPAKKVRRGPYVFTLKWIYAEINRYWNQPNIDNPYCKLLWTLMYKGTNWLCKMNQLSVKNYEKLKAFTPKNHHGKTYAPFYTQMLETALISMHQNKCDEKRWRKYVWRYQNGFAVSSANSVGLIVDNRFQNMALQQLLDAPINHLPNNFSKDHNGWNEDNRWIRLLHRNKIPNTIDVVQVYNGLDFLCLYSGMRNSILLNSNRE